jgi:hypothetical protein
VVVFVPATHYAISQHAQSLIGDVNAEGDLYFEAERLSEYLCPSGGKAARYQVSVPARIEALWILTCVRIRISGRR